MTRRDKMQVSIKKTGRNIRKNEEKIDYRN